MASAKLVGMGFQLLKRATDEEDTDPEEGDSAQKELFAAWALFISIMLLIVAFFTSYMLQMKKVTAIHETVISIFAGMIWKSVIMRSNAYTLSSHRNGGWACSYDLWR
jgi:sodium/hydrogen exchanger-like protein 6/7